MKPKSIEKSCYKYKDIWSDKNDLLPEMVSISNGKKFLFNCLKCSHEYQQSPHSKSQGVGCPYCSNQKRCGDCERCLKNSCFIYKDMWSDKNNQECEYVAISCNKKFLFNCLKCSHDYEQTPSDKTSGKGCPYCSNQKRCGNCNICLDNSCFGYKDIWSDKNKEKCEQIALHSNKKFWFNCLNCSHDYEQSPSSKTNQGVGCPYCSNQKRCGECERCLENSCFRYKDTWSDKNKDNCEQIAISNGKKFIFNCLKCSHEYEQSPHSKTTKGVGCPYCDNKLRCGGCDICLDKSCFKYKDIWSDKNNQECEYVAIRNDKKFIFVCLKSGHEYDQSPDNKSKGQGCPYCVNKTELKVADFLKEKNIKFKRQFKIKKYYDFYLPDFNLILEIDGDQHFRQVSNWKCPDVTMNNDVEKMKTGLENSISFLRIYQPDIWEDKIDWETIILKNLYKRTLPDISYVSSKTDIYDSHQFISNQLE